MLCGVGGRTVEEAKSNITLLEFYRWCQFRNRYGSFHAGMRIDRAMSRIGTLLANVQVRKTILSELDLSPYDAAIKAAEEEREATPDAIFALIQSVAKKE